MVSKITIFEPHFDGAQFGPASIGGKTTDDEEMESSVDAQLESTTSRSRSRWIIGIGVLAASLVLGVVAVRRAGDGEMETIDVAETVDEIEVE